VLSKKQEVQTKSEQKLAPNCGGEDEYIGMFLAWMFLYWAFTLLLAALLVLTA
jgi:hypothetical protein